MFINFFLFKPILKPSGSSQTIGIVLLATCLLLLNQACHKHAPLQNKLKRLDERITLLELRRSETEAEFRRVEETRQLLEAALAASEKRYQALELEVQQLQQDAARLRKETQALEAKLKQFMAERKAAKPAANKPVTKPRVRTLKPKRDRNRDVTRAYRGALTLLGSGKTEEAADTLETITRDHANHILAPNAYYWLGEIAYDAKSYHRAIDSFQQVLTKYPRSGKASDALLKIGKSLERMGKLEDASETYRKVLMDYPKSRAAKLAQEWLQ